MMDVVLDVRVSACCVPFMFGKHDHVWRALVWAMMPLTLAAGLPRMHCRCAEAQGLTSSKCCFRGDRNESTNADRPVRECCQHKQLKLDHVEDESQPVVESHTDCPTCCQLSVPPNGNCCSWTPAILSALGQGIRQIVSMNVFDWELVSCGDATSMLAHSAQHQKGNTFLPQLDRITVFQHLVI